MLDVDDIKLDPVLRVRQMARALHTPISVAPDAPLQKAVTLMLTHDFSQLPVLSSPRSLKGVISWRTIGSRMAMGGHSEFVQDCMEPGTTIDIEALLFEAVELVSDDDYVVVLENARVAGILTASDFSLQFRALAKPFVLIGEVEQGLRLLLDRNFSASDLDEGETGSVGGSHIEDPSALSFGDYVRLVEKPAVWERLGLSLDRVVFRERLERVRKIRNKVMHFRPDGITDDEVECLQAFSRFIRRLREVRFAKP